MSDSGEEPTDQTGPSRSNRDEATAGGPSSQKSATAWILVDQSARKAAFETVAKRLCQRGIDAQIVTITDVLGSVARDALAGGAERLLRGLRVAFHSQNAPEDLIGAVRRARPDLLAVTNPRYGRPLNMVESIAGIRTLQVGILPDFNLSTQWITSSLQAFVVPTDQHRQRLVASGFVPERVLVASPAIRQGFAGEIDRREARQGLGFDQDKVVLVRGEGFAPKVIEKIVFQTSLVDPEARFIFHHNGDGATAAALRRAADQYRLRAAMFGKVANLERFVAASDLVVASTSEAYVADILAQGRPLVLVGAGEEGAAQAEFLGDLGAARYVVDVLRLGSELGRAIDDQALAEATRAAGELGARDGSEQVADALARAIEHTDDWLDAPAGANGPNRQPPGDDSSGGDSRGDDRDQPAGPFETIGAGGADSADPSQAGSSQGRPASFAGLSTADAKDQLAELILMEREFERELANCQKQQERWRNRLELAREWDEQDLADEAKRMLRDHLSDAEDVERDLEDVRRQKTKIKRAAGRSPSSSTRRQLPPSSADLDDDRRERLEERFRRMENDRNLDDLKDQIRRDLGD